MSGLQARTRPGPVGPSRGLALKKASGCFSDANKFCNLKKEGVGGVGHRKNEGKIPRTNLDCSFWFPE